MRWLVPGFELRSQRPDLELQAGQLEERVLQYIKEIEVELGLPARDVVRIQADERAHQLLGRHDDGAGKAAPVGLDGVVARDVPLVARVEDLSEEGLVDPGVLAPRPGSQTGKILDLFIGIETRLALAANRRADLFHDLDDVDYRVGHERGNDGTGERELRTLRPHLPKQPVGQTSHAHVTLVPMLSPRSHEDEPIDELGALFSLASVATRCAAAAPLRLQRRGRSPFCVPRRRHRSAGPLRHARHHPVAPVECALRRVAGAGVAALPLGAGYCASAAPQRCGGGARDRALAGRRVAGGAWHRVVVLCRLAARRALARPAGCRGAGPVGGCLQFYAWRAQFGAGVLVPQGGAYLGFLHPALGPFLLSTYHGALVWAPFFVVGLVLARRGVPAAQPAAAVLRIGLPLAGVLTVYFSAVVRDWWGGAAFGPRRLSVLTVAAAFGLAWVLSRLHTRGRILFTAAACTFAAFVLTAHLCGVDDLSVPLCGSVDRANPRTLQSYTGARWLRDAQALPYILRPGYAFRDHSQARDRADGFAAVLAVCALARWLWRAAAASRRAETLLAAGAVAWLAAAALWLAFVIPSNAAANEAWRRIVREGGDPPPQLPYRLAEPAHLVVAARALERGDRGGFERFSVGIGPAGRRATNYALLGGVDPDSAH